MNADAVTFPSETHLLVDACVARVRELAHLDDHPVLPPPPPPEPPREVLLVAPEAKPLPTAREIVAASARKDAPTFRRKGRRRAARWPVALCGLVAVAAAIAAWAASPSGRPSFDRIALEGRAYAAEVAHAAADKLDPKEPAPAPP